MYDSLSHLKKGSLIFFLYFSVQALSIYIGFSIVFNQVYALRFMRLDVVELQVDDAYVRLNAIKIISFRIGKLYKRDVVINITKTSGFYFRKLEANIAKYPSTPSTKYLNDMLMRPFLLSQVTYMLEGALLHDDSLDNTRIIEPGGMQVNRTLDKSFSFGSKVEINIYFHSAVWTFFKSF